MREEEGSGSRTWEGGRMRVEGRGCGTVDRCVAHVSSGSRALAL